MYIGSGLNTVSSLYGQQKGNQMKTPASGEKRHFVRLKHQRYIRYSQQIICCGREVMVPVFLIVLNMRMIRRMKNPVVLAKGVDENGKEFEQRIYINDVNPSNATVVEMRALEAHYKVEKQGGFTSLPLEAGNMGLNDRRDFISMFKKKHRRFKQIGKV